MSMVMQSILVEKKGNSEESARNKMLKIGRNFRGGKVDITKKYYRFRQRDPSRFDPKSYRIKRINKMTVIFGKLKRVAGPQI